MSSMNGDTFNSEEFEEKLHLFAEKLHTINTQQDVICSLSESMIKIKENNVILQLYMRVIEEYSSRAPPEHLIPLVYVLNDFAQKCKTQAHYTSEALFSIFSQINLYYTEYMAKARRCYNIWKFREIFDQETLKRLDCALLGLTPPVPEKTQPISAIERGAKYLESEIDSKEKLYKKSEDMKDTHVTVADESSSLNQSLSSASTSELDENLKNQYLYLFLCCDKVLKDTASVKEKRKIIQNINPIFNSSKKLSKGDKLFKLIEMEWNLRCEVCENLKETLNKLDLFHTDITKKLSSVINLIKNS